MSSILENHIKHLKDSGAISDDVLKASNVFSASRSFCQSEFGLINTTGISFPYINLEGNCIGYRLKKDNKDEYGKYMQKKGTNLSLYFIHSEIEKIKTASIPLIITEGEKKCLSLLSNMPTPDKYAITSIPGCWNFKETTGETKDISEMIKSIPIYRRTIIFIGDSDMFYNRNVFDGYLMLIKYLYENGAKIEVIDLRLANSISKVGADDIIINKGINFLLSRIKFPYWNLQRLNSDELNWEASESKTDFIKRALAAFAIESDDFYIYEMLKKIKKVSNSNLADLKNEFNAIRAKWNKSIPKKADDDTNIYHNQIEDSIKVIASKITRIMAKKDSVYYSPDTNCFIDVSLRDSKTLFHYVNDQKQLMLTLPKYINYHQVALNKEGQEITLKQSHIPGDILGTILTNPSEFAIFKELNFVSRAPIFFEGKVLFKKGYHSKEKVYIDCKEVVPTFNFIHIHKILNSFPFVDEASKHNALGLILTQAMLLNEFIGQHPAAIITGDSPNLGKTTLAQVSCIIANGEEAQTSKFNENNDEENEKNIASMILKSNVVILDNIRSSSSKAIASSCIERSITDRVLNFRRLGTNETISRLNNVLFIFTLNTGRFSEDLIIRSIPIFLSTSSNTKLDLAFDVKDYAAKNREEILGELAGMIIKWIELGMPHSSNNFFSKFPKWGSIICSILVANGFDKTLTNFENAKAVLDPTVDAILINFLEKLLDSKKEFIHSNASSIVKELSSLEAIKDLSQRGQVTKIGKTLAKISDRTINILYHGEMIPIKIERLSSQDGGNNAHYKFSIPLQVTTVTLSKSKSTEEINNPNNLISFLSNRSGSTNVTEVATLQSIIKTRGDLDAGF